MASNSTLVNLNWTPEAWIAAHNGSRMHAYGEVRHILMNALGRKNSSSQLIGRCVLLAGRLNARSLQRWFLEMPKRGAQKAERKLTGAFSPCTHKNPFVTYDSPSRCILCGKRVKPEHVMPPRYAERYRNMLVIIYDQWNLLCGVSRIRWAS